jgi:hypothetical protein
VRKLVVLFILVVFCGTAQAETFGIGVILGEPTGVSAKLWIGDSMAVDLAAAWSFVKESAFHLHADYLFHFRDLIEVSKGSLPLYLGVGGRFRFEKNFKFGVRIPVGLEYLFEDVPLDVFAEVGPIVDLVPATGFDIGGGIGVRYFF